MMGAFKGWKTAAFNVLALLVLLASHYGYDGGNLPAGTDQLIMWLVPVINLVLRKFTDTPMFKRSID